MNTKRLAIIPLFLTIFVDALGMGLIFPILTPLFIENSSPLFDVSCSQEMRQYLFGILLAIYPLMTFLGSPWLGALSDKYGRKSVLLLCMFGNFLGLMMMGMGVAAHSIGLIMFGRFISGLTAASLPIAQAAIIDLSTIETKAKFMSIITAANAIGFSLGPVVSGVFSQGSFFMVSVLPLLTTALLVFLFNETNKGNKNINVSISQVFRDIYLVFKIKSTRFPAFTFSFFLLGYYVAFNYFSTYFLVRLDLSEFSILSLLTYYSVWSAIGLLFIIPYLMGKLTLQKNILISVLIQPVLILFMILIQNEFVFWVVLAPFALFIANGYVALMTFLSNQTAPEHQGRIMGITSSLNALTWGIAPLASALLVPFSSLLPLIASMIAFGFAAVVCLKYSKAVNLLTRV